MKTSLVAVHIKPLILNPQPWGQLQGALLYLTGNINTQSILKWCHKQSRATQHPVVLTQGAVVRFPGHSDWQCNPCGGARTDSQSHVAQPLKDPQSWNTCQVNSQCIISSGPF